MIEMVFVLNLHDSYRLKVSYISAYSKLFLIIVTNSIMWTRVKFACFVFKVFVYRHSLSMSN